jgi:hypothetical protein
MTHGPQNDMSLSRTYTLLTESENSTGGMLVVEAGLTPLVFRLQGDA